MPAAEGRDADTRDRLAWLVSTIEAEIIPRLMLAHRAPPPAQRAAARAEAPGLDTVEALAQLALGADAQAVRARVDQLQADGVPLDSIYLQVLAPAARHLGELWTTDRTDFSAVTAALWRLQQVMYDLSPAFQDDGGAAVGPQRALLAPVPGSQHTFGLLMVSEFFQRAGWNVWTEPAVTLPVLLGAVRTSRFDIIGLSIGSVCHLDSLTQAVPALREASLNPDVGIMIGGPLIAVAPELAAQVGADASAADAGDAVARAQALVESRRVGLRRARR